MQRRLVCERRAVQCRQKERAGCPHLAYNLTVFRLVADEKIALKRRDARAENSSHKCGNHDARRQAQPVDHTTVSGVTKSFQHPRLRVLESLYAGDFTRRKRRMSHRIEDIQRILSTEDDEFRRWLEDHHTCESRLN